MLGVLKVRFFGRESQSQSSLGEKAVLSFFLEVVKILIEGKGDIFFG